MKHSFKLLLLAATTIVLGLPAIASAAVAASSTQFFSGYTKGTLTLNVPIGQLTSCTIGLNGTANNCLGLYIQAWYGFTLGVVGILATIMMMFAGFKYLTSRGNGKAIGEAKDLMVSGISGVVIAFLSYTILSLISPQLLIIHIPAIPTIKDNSGIDISAQQNSPGWTSSGSTGAGGTATACTPGQTTIVNGYDFKGYAESCGHVAGVQKLYDQFSGKVNTAAEADAVIKKFAPNSIITGAMVMSAAKQYNVDAAVIMAEMAQDSSMGTAAWGAQTNNPGNVGNYGKLDSSLPTTIITNNNEHFTQTSQVVNGVTTYNTRTYTDWQAGVNAVGNWLKDKKVK